MKYPGRMIGVFAAAALATGMQAAADPDQNALVIDGETLVTEVKAPEGHPVDTLYSGWRFRTEETQALQVDDFDNPSFIFVDQARDAWETAEGTEGKSCADCHGDVAEGMKGVRAAMPKFNAEAGEVWSLENYVNACRVNRMGAEAWKWDKGEMNAMTALIALQSRFQGSAPMRFTRQSLT